MPTPVDMEGHEYLGWQSNKVKGTWDSDDHIQYSCLNILGFYKKEKKLVYLI